MLPFNQEVTLMRGAEKLLTHMLFDFRTYKELQLKLLSDSC